MPHQLPDLVERLRGVWERSCLQLESRDRTGDWVDVDSGYCGTKPLGLVGYGAASDEWVEQVEARQRGAVVTVETSPEVTVGRGNGSDEQRSHPRAEAASKPPVRRVGGSGVVRLSICELSQSVDRQGSDVEKTGRR